MRVDLSRYLDQRCNDIQRETTQLRGDIDRATHGIHLEISERTRLLDEELDRRITALMGRHLSDVASIKDQAEQSWAAMEHRLTGMNEFRESLRDQAGKSPAKYSMGSPRDSGIRTPSRSSVYGGWRNA